MIINLKEKMLTLVQISDISVHDGPIALAVSECVGRQCEECPTEQRPTSWSRSKKEKESTLRYNPSTTGHPTRLYFLKVLPPLNSITLETKSLIHGPLKDIQHPNLRTIAYGQSVAELALI